MSKRMAKTDMTVVQFLEHMPEIYSKDAKLMSYDTEPTKFGMGHTVPFDIGWTPFYPSSNIRGKSGGGLPYEVLRNREKMTHIQNQKKINDSVAGDLYHIITLLRDEENPASGEKGWFSTDVETTPLYGIQTREDALKAIEEELGREWGEMLPFTVMPYAIKKPEHLYETMTDILNANRDAVDHFRRQREQVYSTEMREELAIHREEQVSNLLDIYTAYKNETTTTKEMIRQLNDVDREMAQKVKDLRYANMKKMYQEDRHSMNFDEKADMQRLKSLPGGENVKPTREIMKEYEKEFKDGAVGIMGYNLESDLRWTSQLLNLVKDAEQYSYLFDPKEINAFCQMHLMTRLRSMEGEELLDTMLSANMEQLPDLFKEGHKKGLPPLKRLSLEVACQTLVDPDTDQKHTAVSDANLSIDLFQKVAEDMAREALKSKEGK